MYTYRRQGLIRVWLILTALTFPRFAAYGLYNVTYADPDPEGGAVYYVSGAQQVGYAYLSASNTVTAAIWSGPSNSVINLSPAGALGSYAYGGAGNQQVGTVWFDSYLDHPFYAAVWNGSSASFRNLHPPGANYSQAFGTSGSQQVGEVDFGPPSWHVAAALWHGTAGSFVDLTPSGSEGTAWAVAAGQQAGVVYLLGGQHAAIWSGTAASFKDLNPPGSAGSVIYATTGSQQVGANDSGAGLWSGTPDSFVSLAPRDGKYYSVGLATIGTAQAGYIQSTNSGSYRHAIIWFGSADQALDLHTNLPAESYRESEARSLWTDGTNIIVGGDAVTWTGMGHPIVWTLTPHACPLICPADIAVCNDHGQCGAIVYYPPPASSDCGEFNLTLVPPSGSFFPVGTNAVVCTAVDAGPGQQTNDCVFLVAVRDCEPPAITSVVATPAELWPPNHKMRPVTLHVSATDNCHLARARIVGVSSTEPSASVDYELTGDLSLNLRAERSGNGIGRVYSITIECADDSGNVSTGVATVAVPH